MSGPREPYKTYRILGHERVVLSQRELVRLIRDGLLDTNTVVIREGETFAVAVGARAEFRHLLKTKPTRPPTP